MVDASPPSMSKCRRLVLHFDVNETIMVGDPASNINFGQSLNNLLAKVAFFQDAKGTHWHDGSPVNLAQRGPEASTEPPPLLTSFEAERQWRKCYEVLRHDPKWPVSRFTEKGLPGEIYRQIYEDLHEQLRWRHAPNQTFAPEGHHFLLPAFFQTLLELEKQGRDFSVVIRTFGTDLPEVAKCIQAFARGEHPGFPSLPSLSRFDLDMKDALWVLRRADRTNVASPMMLRRYKEPLGQDGLGNDLVSDLAGDFSEELGPDEKVLDFISSKAVLGIRDDYHHWKQMKYIPESGKPLWISLEEDVHHIFFDDNIHNKVDDSIVAVRSFSSNGETSNFQPLSGEATRALEGVLLVKAHAVEAIRDPNYFLKQIQRCEQNFSEKLADASLRELLKGRL